MSRRVFCDTSVLVRYFTGDDPARGFAAALLVDGDDEVIISTGVLIELVHALRTKYRASNFDIAEWMVRFLSRVNVSVVDADEALIVEGLRWSQRASARRIPDAIFAAAAERARCNLIATFDEAFDSPSVPVRLL